MAPWLALFRILAAKNIAAIYLVRPLSGHIINLGRQVPGVFHPACRTITQGYQLGEAQVYQQMGWKHQPKKITTKYAEEVGSKFLTWLTLTGTFTAGYFWLMERRSRKKDSK